MKYIPNTILARKDVVNLDKKYSYFLPMNFDVISVSIRHLKITRILCGNLMLLQEVPLYDIAIWDWSAASAAEDIGPILFVRQ